MNRRNPKPAVLLGAVIAAAIAATSPAIAKTTHRLHADAGGNYEVVLGTMKTRVSANKLEQRARNHHISATVERDGRTSYEVEVDGYRTRASADAAARRDTRAGFPATVERS